VRRTFAPAFLLILAVLVATAQGCGSSNTGAAGRRTLILAATTSAQDSGILDEFVNRFEDQYPYRLKAVAVGSGSALFMGRNGDADVMLTHEPRAESEFMEAGNGESIHKVMHNDFIIVGPARDPARIRGLKNADEAFRRIADSGSAFISRGDASGTNAMELTIWGRLGMQPAGNSWYVETGQGMGETLRIADQKDAYTLTDKATFIVMRKGISPKMLVQGDSRLVNQYSVTVVNPEKSPRVNHRGAVAFSAFLRSAETKKLIKEFGWDRYHEHLFYPD
jgi:tungstate transport system substrate-binding protein